MHHGGTFNIEHHLGQIYGSLDRGYFDQKPRA